MIEKLEFNVRYARRSAAHTFAVLAESTDWRRRNAMIATYLLVAYSFGNLLGETWHQFIQPIV